MAEQYTKLIKRYVLATTLLTEDGKYAVRYDAGRQTVPENWAILHKQAVIYTDYQTAWNRLQKAYSDNKHKLKTVTFSLIELAEFEFEGTKLSAEERLKELHEQFSPFEFKPK